MLLRIEHRCHIPRQIVREFREVVERIAHLQDLVGCEVSGLPRLLPHSIDSHHLMAATSEAMHGLVSPWIGDGGLHHGAVGYDIVKARDPPIRCGLGDDGGIGRTGGPTPAGAIGVREIGDPTRVGDALNEIGLSVGHIRVGGRAAGWIRHAPQPGEHIGRRNAFIGIGDGTAERIGDLADATPAVLEREGAAARLEDLLNLCAVPDDRHGIAGAVGDRREQALAVEGPDGRVLLQKRTHARCLCVSYLFIGWPANEDRHSVHQRPGQGLRMVDRDGELQMRCWC